MTTQLDTDQLASINPATDETVGTVPCTPVEAIDGMIATARNAAKDWGARSVEDRIATLRPLGEALKAHREALANLNWRQRDHQAWEL